MIITLIFKNGADLLKCKGRDPCQYALNLLDQLFPEVDDRVERCYRRGPRTPNKPLLDEQRVQILESKVVFAHIVYHLIIIGLIAINSLFADCIKYRFGLEGFSAYESDIVDKLNQKCRDAKKKVRTNVSSNSCSILSS